MFKTIKYYFWRSYRRKLLDDLQLKYISFYKGIVLDIGGRDRGAFRKPKDKVDKWIFADIEASHNPDIILDVANMISIKSESIDVVNAIELFEHVENIREGIKECHRVLKPEGHFILSVPFLAHIHADPFDFQRWTYFKLKSELEKLNFKIHFFEINGRFFTVFSEMKRYFSMSLPFGLRHLAYLSFPFLDFLTKLDNLDFVKNHKIFGNFHGGYFIIAKK